MAIVGTGVWQYDSKGEVGESSVRRVNCEAGACSRAELSEN